MSLAQNFTATFLAATLTVALAPEARAALPQVGQCGNAESVKKELPNAGYGVYITFDSKMLNKNAKEIVRRASIVANSNMSDGYNYYRNFDNDLCNAGQLTNMIFSDNRKKTIDQRFLHPNISSNQSGRLNFAINAAKERISAYPMFQGKITAQSGETGVLTVLGSPDTLEGAIIFSDFQGNIITIDTFETGTNITTKQKYGVQFTPLALQILNGNGPKANTARAKK